VQLQYSTPISLGSCSHLEELFEFWRIFEALLWSAPLFGNNFKDLHAYFIVEEVGIFS
jgi:hypothetical protein